MRIIPFVTRVTFALVALHVQAEPAESPTVSTRNGALQPQQLVSRGSGVFGGEGVSYRVISGETVLRNEDGAPSATIFSFSYLRTDGRGNANRPVLFIFNGGPGSASVWMHLGFFAPHRVTLPNPVQPPTVPPFELERNPHSILDVADLVMIDPVGTGYSRLLPAGKPEQFYGVEPDARSMVQFIEAWLTKHERWNSPKFLVGESYGTVRAALVARQLAGGPLSATGRMVAITLNGIVMLGQALGVSSGDEMRHADNLPSMAATAWHHGKVDKRGLALDAFVAEAAAFAREEYVQALYSGDALEAASRRQIAQRLAAFIGLPVDYVLERNLRVSMDAFRNELLRREGRQLGAYDSRYSLAPPAAGAPPDPVSDDPAMGQYTPVFLAAMHRYLREELQIVVDRPYEAIAFRSINFKWDYSPGSSPGAAPAPQSLAAAMRRNPSLRLFVGTGYFDLVTTLGAANYMTAHTGLPLDRVTSKAYSSGHMPYLGEDSATRLASDLRAFIRAASGR